MKNVLSRHGRDPERAPGVPSLVRTLLVALLLVATAACGGYRFPGETPPAGSGMVSGQVSEVPCSQPGPAILPCKMGPFAGVELTFVGDGTTQTARTQADGRYSIELQPGTWKVTVPEPMRIVSGPEPVTVSAGSTTVANYVVDSGIRYAQ